MADADERIGIRSRNKEPSPKYGALSTDDDTESGSKDGVHLKKEVGFFGGISIVVGIIVGSGIFISPKGVLELSGSVGMSLIIWAAGGMLALVVLHHNIGKCALPAFCALCYAELGTMLKKSGGEYSYVLDSLGPIPAFFISWTSVMVIKPATFSIVCLTFAQYFVETLPICGKSDLLVKLVAAAVLVLLMITNSYSVKFATRIQIVTTLAKTAALAVIIIGGLVQLASGNTGELKNSFKGSSNNPSNIARAFYQALWAYEGWSYVFYVTEEIEKPEKNIPRSTALGVIVVTVLYILTNMSYLTAMTSRELLDAPAVALLWGDRVLKGASAILPVAVLLSTYGAANGGIFTGGRLVYAAAREGHLPEFLSFVQVKRLTPVPSIVFTCLMSIVFLFLGDIGTLLDVFSFAAWIFYGLAVSSLIVLRWSKPHVKRVVKVPIILPVLFVLFSVYLVLAPIINDPKIEFLYAALFLFGGLILYAPLVHFKLISIDKLTTFTQLMLEVAPSPYIAEE